LDQSAGKLAEVLKNRIQYTIHLPEKIKRVDRLRKIVLWIIIVSAVIWIIVYSLKIRTFRRVKLKHILVYAALLVIAFVSTLLYELYLNFILKVGRTKDLTIN
jgi:glucan phosphoethanolaminetransferase (alkaline phosphatase superfamily)